MIYTKFLIDYFSIVLVLLVCITIFIGYGQALLCSFKLQSPILSTDSLWIGFCFTFFFIEVTHLILPINNKFSLFYFSVGCLFTFYFNSLKSITLIHINIIKIYFIKKNTFYSLLFFILISLMMLKAMESPSNYDSGLYHLNSIRWINEFAVIPGIGNIHPRLAFNQSWFGLAALLNITPLFNYGYAVIGLLLLIMSFIQITDNKLLFKLQGHSLFNLILILTLIINLKQISSPTPDLAINILEIIVTFYLLQLVQIDKSDVSLIKRKFLVLVVLSITIVTIKLSGLVFSLFCILLGIYLTYNLIPLKVALGYLIIFSFFIGLPHILTGYLLSGVPLFPSTIAGIWSFDWAMTSDSLQNLTRWIYCWARAPGEACMSSLDNWKWIPHWVSRFPLDKTIILISSIIMLFSSVIYNLQNPNKKITQIGLCTLPCLTSIVFWFFTAPDPRFLNSIPSILLALSILILLNQIPENKFFILINHSYKLYLFLIILFTTRYTVLSKENLFSSLQTGFQLIKSAPLEIKYTNTGLKVYVPMDGDQCHDSPLPCTPYFDSNLRFIDNRDGVPKLFYTLKNN